MSNLRDEVFEWAESGRLKPGDAARALDLAGLRPGLPEWRRFLDTLLLWLGVLLVASGVIFFFAFNWQSMNRFSKFALCEAAFAIALIAVWVLGMESALGRAALVGVALMTGGLLALVGQTYQTGADTYQLFSVWALLILPWVVLGRFAPLWLLWLGLLNLSVALYFDAIGWGLFGILFGVGGSCWSLLALNVTALVLWEAGMWGGILWLNRWGARVVGVLAGGAATAIGVLAASGSHEIADWSILGYFAWLAATYWYYRERVFDVFMLAGAVLSFIIVTITFLGKNLIRESNAGSFLLIGLVVIGMSGAGAWWIRRIAQEQPQ